MTEKVVSITIELLGRIYPVRCPEAEVKSLQEAAAYLNQKMKEVQDSGKAINFERIAVISALNIAYDYLQQDQHKSSIMTKINHRIAELQDKIDTAMTKSMQTELIYTTE